MQEFIIAVASGLILAAVSGLVFLAYKHPEGYLVVGITLIVLTVIICGLSVAYLMGFSYGCSYCKNYEAFDIYWDWVGWDGAIGFIVVIFLLLLMKLPAITKADGEDDADDD